MRSFLGRMRTQSVRVLMLAGLLLLSGAAIGLAAAFPLTFISYDESEATRIDQTRLAGQVDVDLALVTLEDLPRGWEPGDAALGPFGIFNSEFCGEQIDTPTPLSEVHTAVFKDPTNDSVLIAQALHVDKWQSAQSYVNDVGDALDECDQFYRSGPAGQTKVAIKGAREAPLIANDFVARSYVAEEGDGVQEWAIFQVGDVVISVLYSGPTAPEAPFLNGVIRNVLSRIDPEDFPRAGASTDNALDGAVTPSSTPSTIDSGAADETEGGTGTEAPPDPGVTTSVVTEGGD
ncbi:hypothetical protein [Dermatobacter hominis]|uniref:hypothetical protein n=1 Tax=Dermatobacter hominis TaxID=2884263 RepID=UPI001D10AF16|nr:hypothetical protein [Dermatobacter hominis]UDY37021.1 hypothetical protein LH044_05655 [Dermatobacter hominis]